jgi:hypothetical protein
MRLNGCEGTAAGRTGGGPARRALHEFPSGDLDFVGRRHTCLRHSMKSPAGDVRFSSGLFPHRERGVFPRPRNGVVRSGYDGLKQAVLLVLAGDAR